MRSAFDGGIDGMSPLRLFFTVGFSTTLFVAAGKALVVESSFRNAVDWFAWVICGGFIVATGWLV